MPRTSLDATTIAGIADMLSTVDSVEGARPGAGRQPVHTCYVPADQVTADLPREWGEHALAMLDRHGGLLEDLLRSELGVPGEIVARVRDKLAREPVEDLRIDFEDGYRVRGEEAEDADAVRAAALVAGWHRSATAPPWTGIRFKSFDTRALLERGVRTLDLFLTELTGSLGAPRGLALTFPKVTSTAQVAALASLLDTLETRLGLGPGTLRFEIQIETTRSIVDEQGRLAVPRLVSAGAGRVSALHFGTYDYTAACGLDAAQQHLAHPACDFARHTMQVGAAGAGVWLSDGSTNVLPVGDAVGAGWRTHHALVRRSLEHGFHQGWDLHPAQLVTRYAAVYGYYRQTAGASARRLGAYLSGAGGAVADEPATARALARTLRRAVDCGALTAAEVTALAGTEEWSAHA